MPLHLILGNSGGGKTHTLYERLIREACAFPDRNFLVIVPEQFTLETQRELTDMHPGKSLCNIDILSFQRLGYRLLEEAGLDQREVLDDMGKNLILRRIAEKRRDDLKVLGPQLDRMGMIDEVKSFVSELMQYALTPEDLDRMIDEAKNDSLKRKLEDIRILYADFLDEIEGKALTAEGLLTQTGLLAADSAILSDSVIALDGYTGFTPAQSILLSSLMRAAREFYVTVTIDPAEGFLQYGSMTDLFWLSRRTIRRLMRTAEETGTDTADPVFCTEGARYRFADAPQLYHLEQHLFRGTAGQDTVYNIGADEKRQICVQECTEPRDELTYCLQIIKRTVMEGGGNYGDFAIMTGDLSRYENFAPSLFADYAVPYFLDRTRRLDSHPFPQAICALLAILRDDFSYHSIFLFLRSGFGPLSEEETDLLENYVLAAGIRGFSVWKKKWKKNPQHLSEEELAGINALRSRFLNEITPLREAFSDRKVSVQEKTRALSRFLTAQGVQEKLEERAQIFREQGQTVRAREEEQIYPLAMQLLEKLYGMPKDTQITAAEYAALLQAGFSAATLRVAPPRRDTVLFGDMERTRLNHVKTLFLIGANDGVIPGAGTEGGILSEFERQSLKDAGEELAYSARETVLLQHFYLYQNLTKPMNSLQITYAQRASDGSQLRRSVLISEIEKLYQGSLSQCGEPSDQDARQGTENTACPGELLTADAALGYFARQTGELAAQWEKKGNEPGACPENWRAVADCLMNDPVSAAKAQKILAAACADSSDIRLQPQTAHSLYTDVLKGSVSRLEQYAACAFSHFAAYGLNLKERLTASFESADMGTLLHDAVRYYTIRIRETGRTFHDLTETEVDHLADLAMDLAVSDRQEAAGDASASDRQITERLRRVFNRTAHVVTEQIKAGAFEPVAAEQPFHVLWDLPGGGRMQLDGRIDRVDAASLTQAVPPQTLKLIRVVDYKSSGKTFEPEELYEGLSLQLPLYLSAALEQMEASEGEQVLAAGMFYYAMTDPVLEEIPGETQEAHLSRVKKELRLSGPMNDHPEALKAMDDLGPGEESGAVKLKRKKDGTTAASSAVLPQADFAVLRAYAKKKAVETGGKIMAGDVRVLPYRKGRRSSCTYCPYRSVCGFDIKQPQFRYRSLDLTKDEALARMKEELKNA